MVDHRTVVAEQTARRAGADDRRVLNGIYWRLRTGSPWADIPERYGPPTTCYNRFVRWRKLGVWDRIFAAVSQAYEGDLQMVDSSSIRAVGAGQKRDRIPRTARDPVQNTISSPKRRASRSR